MDQSWVKVFAYTVKPVLSGQSKRRPKICYQDQLSLNAVQKYCRMLQESILQYVWPSLTYHLSLRSLFCLFLSGRLRQVLLYWKPLNRYFDKQWRSWWNTKICNISLGSELFAKTEVHLRTRADICLNLKSGIILNPFTHVHCCIKSEG